MNSATDKTYTTLLARIQSGAIAAGEFLVESDLAEALGVSRTPVREAIRRLAADGSGADRGAPPRDGAAVRRGRNR